MRNGRRRARGAIAVACGAVVLGTFGVPALWAGGAKWTAPPLAAARVNPLAVDAGLPGGRKLFGERCASCHGDAGQGTRMAPDLRERDVQDQSDGALFWKISQGNTRRGMPTYSYLPEPQRWQLVLTVRSLSSH